MRVVISKFFPRQVSSGIISRIALALAAVGLVLVTAASVNVAPAQAAVGINKTLNFQGRLLNAAGAVVADGNYNMRFKVYQDGPGNVAGDTGGTLMWTELWQNSVASGTSTGVVVKNGYFSVNLGTYCAFAGGACQGITNTAVDFNQDTLWLSMDVAGTAVSNTPTYDGELLPMRRLASSVYSLQAENANKLGGLTASQFLQTVPGSSSVNVIAPTAASTVALTVKGTTGTSANVLEVFDSTATPTRQAFFDATGSLNVAKTIQPTVTNTTDIGLTGTQFRTGYFGTSVMTPALDANSAVALNIGTTNASAVNIGKTASNIATTITGTTLLKPVTNSTTAFQVQNAAGAAAFTVNSTTGGVTINQGGLTVAGIRNPAAPTLALTATGGTLANATTYTYRLSATGPAGETMAIATNPTSTTTANTTSLNTISWTAVTNATGYKLYRSINGGTTWFVNTLGLVTSAVDNGSNFTWATSGTPSLYSNATGNVSLVSGATLYLDSANDGQISSTESSTILGNYYGAGSFVAIQADSFQVQDTTGYNNNLIIDNTGAATFKNRVNSMNSFRIQNAGGTTLFNADTTNSDVSVAGTFTASGGTIRGAVGSGTNVTGADLKIDAATGTGSGTSGALVFRTAPATGALSVDASSSSNTATTATSLTWSHTVGATANLLMVGFAYTTGTISSVTYNGVAMTQKSTVTNISSKNAVYYLVNPAAGPHNVVITLGAADSIIGGATSFIGADTVTPLGTAVTTGISNSNTITSGAVASAPGEIVFDSLGVAASATASPGAGQTQSWFINNATVGDAGGGSTKAGAASVTTSWSGLGTTADATLIDVSVKPASGSGVNTLAERMRILAAGNVCIATASCTKTLGVQGTIAASSTITASTTPDLAETIAAAGDVEAADVVMADPHNTERVVKASGAYTGAAVGVISDGTSSFMINSYGGNKNDLTGKPMVLAGRVPVKMTDEGGPVMPGDYLTTSSTPGYAMKATHAGPTIGKALGYFSGTRGTVLTLVNVSYADPASEMVNLQSASTTLQQKVDALTAQVSSGSFAALNVSGAATVQSLAVAGQLTAGSLSVAGEADIATLSVSGNATVGGDIIVNGHLVTGGSAPTVAAGSAACANSKASITGTDTAGTVTITAGANACAAFGTLAAVTFSKAYATAPRVILTPTGLDAPKLQYGVGTASGTGFELSSQSAVQPGKTYTYNYFVIQ